MEKDKEIDIHFVSQKDGVAMFGQMSKNELFDCASCLLDFMLRFEFETYVHAVGSSLVAMCEAKGEATYAKLLDVVANTIEDR